MAVHDPLAADLHALVEHLNPHDAVLVGHSMGTGNVSAPPEPLRLRAGSQGVLVPPTPPYLLQTPDNPDGVAAKLCDGFVQAAQADSRLG